MSLVERLPDTPARGMTCFAFTLNWSTAMKCSPLKKLVILCATCAMAIPGALAISPPAQAAVPNCISVRNHPSTWVVGNAVMTGGVVEATNNCKITRGVKFIIIAGFDSRCMRIAPGKKAIYPHNPFFYSNGSAFFSRADSC
ncbi:hypothetical protein [Actinomyces sp. Z5]|uniref:hypothetical protein n=1 Tax=Actinomyces sp. Z5 TaxID=2250216 RepID=UPI0011BE473D|nr:hypothetical protein [Actinomyces sp. Z5]